MKIMEKGKSVVLTSENESDRIDLLLFFATHSLTEYTEVEEGASGVAPLRKRKKSLHQKKCEICGNSYKGRIGLALHQTKMMHWPQEGRGGMTQLPVTAG